MTEVLTFRDIETKSGSARVTIFIDGTVFFTVYGPSIITHTLTREDAIHISKNLEDVVAAYDATVDHYHDQCDEPVTVGGA